MSLVCSRARSEDMTPREWWSDMQGLQVVGSKSTVKPSGEFQSWEPHSLHLLRRRLGLLWRKDCEGLRAERPLQKSRQGVMAGPG